MAIKYRLTTCRAITESKTVKSGRHEKQSVGLISAFEDSLFVLERQRQLHDPLSYLQTTLLMQSNTPRELRQDGMQRQRPLQKSMFLPETHPLQNQMPPRGQQPMENVFFNPLKRSSTAVMENIHQVNQPSPYHYNNLSFTQQNYLPPGMIPPGNIPLQYPIEQRAQSQHELLHHGNSSSLKNLNTAGRSDLSIDLEMRGFNKIQRQATYEAKTSHVSLDSNDTQKLMSQIIQTLKEKHLPSLLKSVKKQFLEEMHLIRVEFQTLREEFKSHVIKQEAMNNDIRSQTNNIVNFNNINNINTSGGREKMHKDGDLHDLQTQYYLLEGKINLIETKMSENFTKFTAQFDRMNLKTQADLKEKIFKISQMKSSLPPIMLEYREVFKIKKSSSAHEDEITYSSCQYHVDRYGYLLDNENHYLIDSRGSQIKLDEKHLKLLEHLKIFHR